MKWRALVLVLFLATLLPAAKPLTVRESADPFTGEKLIATPPLVLRHARTSSGRSAYMAVVLQQSRRPEAGSRFHIQLFCGRSKGRQMDISAGNTLTVWADHRGTSYYSPGTATTRTAPGARQPIRPHALYEDIPADDFIDMARAQSIRMQISGSPESIQGDLGESDLQVLRQFVETYVRPALR